MKAPHEGLSKVFRQTHKIVEKEISHVGGIISELCSKQISDTNETYSSLDKLVVKLQGLKRKVEESKREEEVHVQHFKARLNYIKALYNTNTPDHKSKWNISRVDRVMVDYMLREGLYDSAAALAQETEITDLVDIEIFISSRKVIEGLINHDCTEALQWCADNRSKLKKIKSNLEFSLRIQEFIELVRAQKLLQAIIYSRKHLAPSASTNMKDIQKAMAALAFLKDTKCVRYKPMFASQHWSELIEQFKHDCYVLFSLTSNSLLSITLEAGLSALKTPMCSESANKNPNCPACNKQFQEVAQTLPCALHSHSRLVCRLTGEIMNEDNPPMVLPNGQAYSKKGLLAIAAKNNGKVICPQSGVIYKLEELRKVYIT